MVSGARGQLLHITINADDGGKDETADDGGKEYCNAHYPPFDNAIVTIDEVHNLLGAPVAGRSSQVGVAVGAVRPLTATWAVKPSYGRSTALWNQVTDI